MTTELKPDQIRTHLGAAPWLAERAKRPAAPIPEPPEPAEMEWAEVTRIADRIKRNPANEEIEGASALRNHGIWFIRAHFPNARYEGGNETPTDAALIKLYRSWPEQVRKSTVEQPATTIRAATIRYTAKSQRQDGAELMSRLWETREEERERLTREWEETGIRPESPSIAKERNLEALAQREGWFDFAAATGAPGGEMARGPAETPLMNDWLPGREPVQIARGRAERDAIATLAKTPGGREHPLREEANKRAADEEYDARPARKGRRRAGLRKRWATAKSMAAYSNWDPQDKQAARELGTAIIKALENAATGNDALGADDAIATTDAFVALAETTKNLQEERGSRSFHGFGPLSAENDAATLGQFEAALHVATGRADRNATDERQRVGQHWKDVAEALQNCGEIAQSYQMPNVESQWESRRRLELEEMSIDEARQNAQDRLRERHGHIVTDVLLMDSTWLIEISHDMEAGPGYKRVIEISKTDLAGERVMEVFRERREEHARSLAALLTAPPAEIAQGRPSEMRAALQRMADTIIRDTDESESWDPTLAASVRQCVNGVLDRNFQETVTDKRLRTVATSLATIFAACHAEDWQLAVSETMKILAEAPPRGQSVAQVKARNEMAPTLALVRDLRRGLEEKAEQTAGRTTPRKRPENHRPATRPAALSGDRGEQLPMLDC